MILKVKSVDHYGYNGREFHPENRHIGLQVRVVRIQVLHFSAQSHDMTDLSRATFGESRRAELVAMLADEGNLETMFVAYTSDGEMLELMAHEVEVVSL